MSVSEEVMYSYIETGWLNLMDLYREGYHLPRSPRPQNSFSSPPPGSASLSRIKVTPPAFQIDINQSYIIY